MAVRTASDVAELESEVVILRGEMQDAKVRIAVLENENAALRVEAARMMQRTREEMIKNAEVETIINQVSSGLIGAISRMNRNRAIQKEALRAEPAIHLHDAEPTEEFRASPLAEDYKEPPQIEAGPMNEEERPFVRPRMPKGPAMPMPSPAKRDSRIPLVEMDLGELTELSGDRH